MPPSHQSSIASSTQDNTSLYHIELSKYYCDNVMFDDTALTLNIHMYKTLSNEVGPLCSPDMTWKDTFLPGQCVAIPY